VTLGFPAYKVDDITPISSVEKHPPRLLHSLTMFSKVALFITAAFAVSALATPISGSCNSGPVQCCSTLYAPGSTEATNALVGLVGVVVDAITAQVGVECNPISIFGLGSGASWYFFPSFVGESQLTIVLFFQRFYPRLLRGQRLRYALYFDWVIFCFIQ